MPFTWQKGEYDPGFLARIGNITLSVAPDRTKFGKPMRGTKWRAGVSSWDEPSRTISRFGKDVHMQLCNSSKEAMCLAEQVYSEAIATTETA